MPLLEIPPRLDTPHSFGATPAKVRTAFRELRCANRYWGGTRSILTHLAPLVADRPHRELRVLDVGSGAGDIPEALAAWARKRDLPCQIVALDRHPDSVRSAAAASLTFPEVQALQANGFAPPFRPRTFDVVLCSMMLHYFSDDDAARMLSVLASLAKRAVVIADLERHWIPPRAIDILSALLCDRIIRRGLKDPVLRGFTRHELDLMAGKAGLRQWRIYRHFPFRLVLVGRVDGQGSSSAATGLRPPSV